jgi:hypothetical protein
MWNFHMQVVTGDSLVVSSSMFGLSVLLTGKYVFHLLVGIPAKCIWLSWLLASAACLLIFWITFDMICALQADLAIRESIKYPITCMVVTCIAAIGSWLYLKFPLLRSDNRHFRRAPTLWLILGISTGLCSWSGYRFYSIVYPTPDSVFDIFPPGQLQGTEFEAVTDLGRKVPLMQWKVDNAEFARFDFAKLRSNVPGADAVIPRTLPDTSCNCHGWVFTGGSFHVPGSAVEWILQDNGYQLVGEPHSDDLVIYRDSRRKIVHTGLVRSVLADGTVIVESKWSIGGRFLHRPEDEPYSPDFAFYRSPREGHFIGIVAATKARLILPLWPWHISWFASAVQ